MESVFPQRQEVQVIFYLPQSIKLGQAIMTCWYLQMGILEVATKQVDFKFIIQ
jgi:hypothetical protein